MIIVALVVVVVGVLVLMVVALIVFPSGGSVKMYIFQK